MKEISSLILRMATENPAWGYSRIQGALRDLDHRVARSTVAKVLKDNGLTPAPGRPSSWRAFLRAHWAGLPGGDTAASTSLTNPRASGQIRPPQPHHRHETTDPGGHQSAIKLLTLTPLVPSRPIGGSHFL